MARLQILYLPSETVGDVHRSRFALVIDQAPADMPADTGGAFKTFSESIGAQGELITPLTLEVAQSEEEEESVLVTWDHRAMAEEIADMLRARLQADRREVGRLG